MKTFKEKIAIASSKKTKAEDLDALLIEALNDKTSNCIEQLVAKNQNTSSITLNRLSKHPHQQVLLNVANNPATTTETLIGMYGIHQYLWVNNVIIEMVGKEVLKNKK